MVTDPDKHWNLAKKIVGTILAIVGFLSSLKTLWGTKDRIVTIQGTTRFYTILVIGAIAAIGYGILWRYAEKWMGRPTEVGDMLPTGFPAFVLSLTLVVPLIIVPPIYEVIVEHGILPPKHWFGAAAAVAGGIIAHLLMYGIPTIGFIGIRFGLMPPLGDVGWMRAILTEGVYAVAYFGGIALTYRVVVAMMSSEPTGISATTILLSSLVFVFGMATYIIILYPESLTDPGWVRVRGILSG